VEIYGNKVDMTGANGITLVDLKGRYSLTGNHVHDNIIVSHDTAGIIGGDSYDVAAMLVGGNTWDRNQFFMPDANRFVWGGTYKFSGFEAATQGTGSSISQIYPDESNWISDTLGANGNGRSGR
jgi:hypothetical protein